MRSASVSMPSRVRKAFIGAGRPEVAQADGVAVEGVGEVAEGLVEAQAVIAGLLAVRPGNLSHCAQSKRPESTTTPPIEVPLPERNLVVEWTTMSAPHSNGRHR